jgi:hypothetical protein
MVWTEKVNNPIFNANPVNTMSVYRNALIILIGAALLLAPVVSAQQNGTFNLRILLSRTGSGE